MPSRLTLLAAAAALALGAGHAIAGELDVRVSDPGGAGIANAVISLLPAPGVAESQSATLPDKAVINQNFETFFPLVTIVPLGGSVVFKNSDRTMHQVYSFSPPKQFEFEVDIGQTSPPVVFDKPGIVAIGCNIHDQMITYVVVSDNPLTKLSDDTGAVHFAGLAPGHYQLKLWQPDLAPGFSPPVREIDLTSGTQSVSITARIVPRMAGMSHMGNY